MRGFALQRVSESGAETFEESEVRWGGNWTRWGRGQYRLTAFSVRALVFREIKKRSQLQPRA